MNIEFLCANCPTECECAINVGDDGSPLKTEFICPKCSYKNIYCPDPGAAIIVNCIFPDGQDPINNKKYILSDYIDLSEQQQANNIFYIKIGRDAKKGSHPDWADIKLPVNNNKLSSKHILITVYTKVGDYLNNTYTISNVSEKSYLAIENTKGVKRIINNNEELYLMDGFKIYTCSPDSKLADQNQLETTIIFRDKEKPMLTFDGTKTQFD